MFRFKAGFSDTVHPFNVWQQIVIDKELGNIFIERQTMFRSRTLSLLQAALLVAVASLGTFAVLIVGPADASVTSSPPHTLKMNPSAYASGQVLVRFKSGISSHRKGVVTRHAGVNAVLKAIGPLASKDTLLLGLDPGTSVEETVRNLSRNRDVLYAEPNYLVQQLYTPSDPDFPQQWGLYNSGQQINGVAGTPSADIKATRAWEVEQGTSNPVTVAVLDSGINPLHPDLKSKIWINNGEVRGNNKDDDGNG